MESQKETKKPRNPRAGANIFSALTFSWVIPTFWKAYQKDLEEDDLFEPLKEHNSAHIGHKLEKAWNNEVERCKASKRTPSLTRAIIKVFGPKLLLYAIPILISEICLRIGQPLLLGQFLRYFSRTSGSDMTIQDAYMFAAGIVLCSGLNILVWHPYMFAVLHLGLKLRVAACALIYRKALRLNKTSRGQTTTGQIVNLLSNDVVKFDNVFLFLHYLWVGPLQCLIITYLLWEHVGIASIIGTVSLLIFIPFQGAVSKKSSVYRLRTAMKTDERIRLMDEIISGIQVIKMYTWEIPFVSLVSSARKKEINEIKKNSYLKGMLLSLMLFHTRIAIFITILSYILLGGSISAEKVFVLTALYNSLRQTMSSFFPQGSFFLAEGLASSKRICAFLQYGEHVPDVTYTDQKVQSKGNHNGTVKISSDDDKSKVGIVMSNASATWTLDAGENTLNKVSVDVASKELAVIIGPVGSGKTSLLHTFLRELPLTSGSLEVRGTISYASQEPWLFEGNVRQNILFGLPYDKERYRQVIKFCALRTDLETFPYGDRTIVGERGVSLSGGQKARINLARAVYKDADIYLLDDPLSAVDTHVGKQLFDNCISGFLKNKTVVLVTHQIQYLESIKKIILLENGSIKMTGTFDELKKSGLDFTKLLLDPEDETVVESTTTNGRGFMARQVSLQSVGSNVLDGNKGVPAANLETKEQGAVGGNVYRAYFGAGGSCCALFFLLFLFLASQGLASSGDYWITYWVNLEEHGYPDAAVPEVPYNELSNTTDTTRVRRYIRAAAVEAASGFHKILSGHGSVNGTESANSIRTGIAEIGKAANFSIGGTIVNATESLLNQTSATHSLFGLNLTQETCIIVFSSITALTIIITLARSFNFFLFCVKASTKLHNSMFESVIRATMHFFNTNNSGRTLNRFSKDMGIIDELLPQTLMDVLQIGLSLTFVVIMVAVVNPWLLIPTASCLVIFYVLRKIFLATARAVKRLDGTTRSPVLGHLNASVQGLTTIRAFGAQEILVKEFDNHQDLNTSAGYLFIASNRAFGFWLDTVCFIYIGCVTFSFLLFSDGNTLAGNVGFAITQVIGITGLFQWGMRQAAELENIMTSVERILEYTDLESEPPLESTPDKKPPPSWPEQGKIEFKNLKLRYSVGEPWVLKGLSFTISPQEKIGIVGRTGAGKSSLTASLFNLTDLDGRIEIDGVDTTSIGLHDLRSKISIIPQEPFLFSGSVRKNLDPFDEYQDSILWRALEEVELKELVKEMACGLESAISEGGSNLSVGQRQLVCLARAIVQNNKILILDEATANVDPKTDGLIQQTIRKKFSHCTVLTVAHRLHTVMDCDKIMVMSAGKVVEYDHPHNLLQNKEGHLMSMVSKTGKNTEDFLRGIAAQNFEVKSSPAKRIAPPEQEVLLRSYQATS